MDARQARETAKAWVRANLEAWPGLRAAHLVGGITTMPDSEHFPASKDVDVHLIFDEGSPALQPTGPFPNIIEVSYSGLSIEAGIKPVTDYQSAEAVLGNPEIAHHLLVDSLLFDPSGLLRELQERVKRDYPRREWVLARIEHERRGVREALGLRPMAAAMLGASGEANILGYSTTFVAAAIAVATLNAPKIGSRMAIHLRKLLDEQGRLDLYEKLLALLGLSHATPEQATVFLEEGGEAFDLAVEVRRTPHPFQQKMQRHLRPYFVETCQAMITDGDYREALYWTTPFVCSATDIILTDGPEAEKPTYAALQARLLTAIGMDTTEARDAKFEEAPRLYDRFFALAEEIVARDPRVAG